MPAKSSEDGAPHRILACDTTQGACSVAVMHGATLLSEIVTPMQRGHAEALLPMIIEALKQADLQAKDLTRLAVTIGPGGFTGVRLGLAAMRGYATALGIPLIGVGSFAAMAQADTAPEAVLVAVDVRRGQVYAQLFDETRGPVFPPQLFDIADLQDALPGRPFRVIGSAFENLNSTEFMSRSDAPSYPQARYVAQLAMLEDAPDKLPLPLYLRPADATLPDPAKRPQHAAVDRNG